MPGPVYTPPDSKEAVGRPVSPWADSKVGRDVSVGNRGTGGTEAPGEMVREQERTVAPASEGAKP